MKILPACAFWAAFSSLFLSSACSTLMEQTGRLLDGSAFAETTDAVYENKDAGFSGQGVTVSRKRTEGNGEYLLIEFAAFPTLGIRTTTPDMNHRVVLESLEYFGPNLNGRNVFSRELSGEGRFKDEWYTVFLTVPQTPEILDISGGMIARNGARITGSEALAALRNRSERIDALVSWMAFRLEENDPLRVFEDEGVFKEFWEPILFPETVAAKKRPPGWAAAAEGGRWQRGEDIAWSVDYTEMLFADEEAENLRPVRNSGTLLRDWEEALPWIFLQFEWDEIKESLLSEIRLTKVK
ncbi:MAG: hypothetical protein LBF77_02010 [Spirochaetaceae bacterium]|jgi:hypothetical protein|nr:hypothetical protein [Spirochaetaceae bacterium]